MAAMAWPLAVGLISFTVMGVVDTLLMGQVSTEAQAGVGLANALVFTFASLFRGLATGAQSLVAAADGAGDRVRVERAGGAALLIGVGSGLVAALALEGVRLLALPTFVPEAPVLDAAQDYLAVRVWGMPLDLLCFGLMSALQGLGDTRARMWASIVGNVVNVGLDLVLIFGIGPVPAMGAVGAGVATVAGTLAMLVIYAVRYQRLFGRPRRPTREVVESAVTLGLPAGAQMMLGSLAWTVMNLTLARIGAAHLAASQIVINVVSVSFLPGFGLGEAGGVLVGRYLGAGRPRTAARAVRSARRLALYVMGAFGVVFVVAAEPIAAAFNPDPEVVRLAVQLLWFAAAFQLFDAVAMTHLCALRSAGDTRFTLVLTTTAAWGVTVPLTLLLGLGLGWGAPGAWLGMTLEIALLALLTGQRVEGLRSGRVGRTDLLLGRA